MKQVAGMGLTYVNVRIAGDRGSRELRLLVDTGSIFTWIPGGILREVGIEPASRRRFKTIEGREITRGTGEAFLEVMDERATRIVVFAEEGDAAVLGADSLEGLGLEVDPTTKQLRKVEAFIAF